MSRPATIGGIVVALLIGGGVVFFLNQGTPEAPDAAPAAAAVPTEAPPAPAAADETKPVVPFNREHVRMSNVKVLKYPEKKDYSKVKAPEKIPPPAEDAK